MRKKLIGALLAVAGLVATADTASAIRWGQPDNGEHPMVGLMVAYDASGAPLWRCSGTMIAPDRYLTAGHCTFGASKVGIFFSEYESEIRAAGYPGIDGADVTGTPYSHPQYNDAAFYLHDVGVVVLDETVAGPYASTAPAGYLDQYLVPGGKAGQRFEVVGYGLQRNMPDQTGLTQRELNRLKADVRLINGDRTFGGGNIGTYVVFTNNANTGGTCNGDSGGPTFASTSSTVVVAVTSFGMNARCAGTGGGYRIDQTDDLAFIANPTSGQGPA